MTKFLMLLLLTTFVSATNIEYKREGKYKIVSNIHLINSIAYLELLLSVINDDS